MEEDPKKQLGSAPTTPAPLDSPAPPAIAAGSGPDSTLDMPQAEVVAAAGEPGPGAAIGHFRVRKKLGAGGMGIVLEAEDADLGRRVAIKLVRAEADVPAYRDRLLREAKAMARLEHPNVVRVYEVGSDGGRLFIAMELVDGVTLTAWLQERRTWREVVAMFAQVGAGLAAVHGAGLVHRDFKPDNVLVDRTDRARVADFGLARIDDLAAPQLTKSGVMMGTPGYMAPEQQFGSGVDARADQYSFCVALREALGGRPLDEARWKAVPDAVRAVVTRGLSYDPDERFATLDALLAALAAAVPAVDDNATVRVREPVAKPVRPRWPVALAALAGLGVIAGGVAYVTSRRHDPAVDKTALPAMIQRDAAPAAAPTADAALAIAPPIDARLETVRNDAGVKRVASGSASTVVATRTGPARIAAGSAALAPGTPRVATGSAALAPPNTPGGPLVADGPTTKHLPAAKPGDPAHLVAVRAAIRDLGYDGFDVDHPPSDLQAQADAGDAIAEVKLGMVKRRHGDCGAANGLWEHAASVLKPMNPPDEGTWNARAWLGRALCSLGNGHADDAWEQVQHAWVMGNRPEIQLLMAFAKYDVAVAANDADGKNVAYALLLTAEHLKDATVHHALALWLDGLGLGLHQDAAIH